MVILVFAYSVIYSAEFRPTVPSTSFFKNSCIVLYRLQQIIVKFYIDYKK